MQRCTVTLLDCPGAKSSVSWERLAFTGTEGAPGCSYVPWQMSELHMQQVLSCCRLHITVWCFKRRTGAAFNLMLRYFRRHLGSICEKGAEKMGGMMPCQPSRCKKGTLWWVGALTLWAILLVVTLWSYTE